MAWPPPPNPPPRCAQAGALSNAIQSAALTNQPCMILPTLIIAPLCESHCQKLAIIPERDVCRCRRLHDASAIGLLVRVIAGAHQRPRLDVAEAHLQRLFL